MRVLITGAGRAIGAATATELTGRGHHVVATARDVSLLDGLDVAQRLPLDVTSEESVRAVHAAAGELDAIVNNAALNAGGPLEDYPLDRLARLLDTNTLGPLRVLQPVMAGWRARRSGVVVNVSSVQGRVATPLEGAYSASKHALEALSDTLHYELGHFGIRVVVVEPGYVAPGMKGGEPHLGPAVYDELRAQWADTADKVTGPGGRPGPESVATAVADAIEDPATPIRVEVGDDAKTVLATRRSLDDEAFEAAMRAVLGMTW
ncbi:MAG TPA: SDR family NAD(P)-dependent oxidoreductase [Acidimicrobiales bacterium]|jgi:NAD(P)-dependent dehydrogenase (short-subunit alcohol dehydrogenase family)|nr:SDR family NAD(P)-dependent oxidoreductase [Acidimicrobiales bacterium]